MAIGWGKSYEEQMEEANQRASKSERTPKVSPEERTRLQRMASLEQSRSRVLSQLEVATVPAHREMLMKALQAIEKETDAIEQSTNKEHKNPRQI